MNKSQATRARGFRRRDCLTGGEKEAILDFYQNWSILPVMDQPTMRLELLKLTYTNGREASEAVERAKVLEGYVLENSQKTAKSPGNKPRRPQHLQGGNPKGPSDGGKDRNRSA